MLVLSRRVDESVIIADGIEIKVIEVRGRGASAVVKLGIRAPADVKVLRKEVFDEVAAEMRRAAMSSALPEEEQQDS
ncbi:MAG: carbon storage regulator [Bacillota bacterium]